MGPYCRFCDHRCFVPLPEKTPRAILEAYGSSSIIATCARGQAFEVERVGYCYDTIMSEIEKGERDAVALSR